MAKRVLRFREENREIFELIKKGLKKVETRAATEKYQQIGVGDVAVFVCGGDRFTREVRAVERFKTVPALLRKHRLKEIHPKLRTVKELTALYHGFTGYKEKIKKFGLVAIEI